MKILSRYLAKEIYSATAIILIAFLGLFAFFDFVNELDSIGKDSYALHHALIYVLMIMPGRVYELFPIAVLIGTLYALTTLARHSEITVMRASGMSSLNLLGNLTLIGSVFVILTFIFGEYIAPPAESAAQQWRLTATNSAVSQQLRSGLWVRDGAMFINVRTIRPDRTMEHIRIYQVDENYKLVSISEAEQATYDNTEGKKQWRIENLTRIHFHPDRTEREQLPEMLWRSDLTPEVLSVLMVVPERMSVTNLWAYIRHLRENQQDASRYEIALWKKILYPFAALVMMALALPFALNHDRMGGVSVKVFLGVMLGIGFHLLNGLFSNLGVLNAWTPALVAITPSLIFLSAAILLLYVINRR